ncbi:MAG TPA: hypothetical protein VFI24_27170 [Pyrinomonadaceae bacterium]|nr:hypothetical protein [Pyrinomonadaceae bacterium]
MSKVVSIDRGRFLRYYLVPSKLRTILEEAFFVLGVLGTIVAPQAVYSAIGGPVSPWIFVICAQAGVIVGLVRYIYPDTIASIVDRQTAPISRDERSKRRKLS